MSSGTIELGKAVRDFTKSDLMPEYTNVEFQVDNEHSVYAKAVGSVLPEKQEDRSEWSAYSQTGHTIAIMENGFEYVVDDDYDTPALLRVSSNNPIFRYADMSGRTVHLTFDVVKKVGSSWDLTVYAYTRPNYQSERGDNSNDKSNIAYNTTVSDSGSFTFDFTVPTTGEISKYPNNYFAFTFSLFAVSSADVEVKNIRAWVDSEDETTLVAVCPFADSVMARRVLQSLSGFRYKPYEATGARLDMAAEFGDKVIIDNSAYGLYEQDINFSSESVSTISAPSDQELEHEFSYVPTTERRFQREVATLKSELNIQSGKIEAKVDQQGGSRSSFGWTLEQDNFTVYSGNAAVLKVDKDGAQITGRVNATSGNIGGCEIVNGVLQVSAANIGTINANQITAGYLSVDRIQQRSLDGSKLAENSVANFQLDTNAVQGYNVSGGSISPAKTSFSGTLGQVGVNQSDLSAIKGYFLNRLHLNTLEMAGNIFIGTHAFRPIQAAVGSARYVLGSVN